LHVAEAVCAALVARSKSGRGQHVEISMLDVAVHFLWLESMWNHVYVDHEVEMPDFQSIYKLYQTDDGWAVVHGIATDAHWQALCVALGLDELLDDARFGDLYGRLEHGQEVHRRVEEKTAKLSTLALVELLGDAGVPVAPVNSAERLIADPQVAHRQLLVQTDHPSVGKVRQVRPPVIFSDTPSSLRRHAPRTGEHTDDVLTDLLNLSSAEIESLRQRAVIS
jgi:crotonobetainyl-CoA:carnitine CoA-transferase CaiB-like acyl-CoA transferase